MVIRFPDKFVGTSYVEKIIAFDTRSKKKAERNVTVVPVTSIWAANAPAW